MRERDINRQMFHRGHYEVIAKRFRVALEPYMNPAAREVMESTDGQMYVKAEITAISGAIIAMAVEFAKRLQADNEAFDPIMFLDRCSPDPEVYPISTLWEEAMRDNTGDNHA